MLGESTGVLGRATPQACQTYSARCSTAPVRLQKNVDALRHAYYLVSMIKSFKCKDTEKLFNDRDVKKFRSISRKARMKLEMINAAVSLKGLKIPPGNRLEALKGDRKGQYSIRIDSQWRICFKWQGGNIYDVEIVDYH